MILGRKGENLEFEKLSHFLNLLDFQLLSQQVLSRVVVYIDVTKIRRNRAIVNIT